jgi:hypothetical protein
MNPLAHTKTSIKSNSLCADLTRRAERELSAYFSAVTQLFGSEQAELSAEEWLHELIKSDTLPTSAREWQSITTRVSARLASRVGVTSLSPEPLLA